MDHDAERRALLAWNAHPRASPVRILRLTELAGSAAAALREPERWWAEVRPRTRPAPSRAELERLGATQRAACAAAGASALIRGDDAYPGAFLDERLLPPPVIFVRGDARALADGARRVALIGARACTPYGRAQAERLGRGLATHGVTVVSGAARGIDRAGMEGALDADGRVIAFLGSGLDRPYPSEAAGMLDRVVASGGAVVSEFAFGARPHPGHFPRRNRLIAAASEAVCVVQATRKSGSMTTVGTADALGRPVAAVPGPVDSVVSAGPHELIRRGALLVDGANDLMRQLDGALAPEERGREHPVMEALGAGDRTLEELARDLGETPDAVLLQVIELELQGRVVRRDGGVYHRTGPAP